MKRSFGVNLFISIILFMHANQCMELAISDSSSIFYGVQVMIANYAFFLNLICGPDTTEENSSEDED